jgi:hypothetical protein
MKFLSSKKKIVGKKKQLKLRIEQKKKLKDVEIREWLVIWKKKKISKHLR